MEKDLDIVQRFAQRPPFAAFDCARALGITVTYAPSAIPLTCQFLEPLKDPAPGRWSITLSEDLRAKTDYTRRYTVAVGIAHFLLHRDIMKGAPHADGVFTGYGSDHPHLTMAQEAHARLYALYLIAPKTLLTEIMRGAQSKQDAIASIAARFSVPDAAAALYFHRICEETPCLTTKYSEETSA